MGDHELLAHKVVILGESAVGKTSIVSCFDEQTFSASRTPTVGASFLSRTVMLKGTPVILNIWDTAGQERYRSLVPTYAHGAQAAILCFDVANQQSFEALGSWLDSLEQFCAADCVLFVVGNKVDLGFAVPQAAAKKWAQEHNAECMFTSARESSGVTELFTAVAESMSSLQGQRGGLLRRGEGTERCC
jgi:small GTP-binding protein